MFVTTKEIQDHFIPLGYDLEVGYDYIFFKKDGNFIQLHAKDFTGTVEFIQEEVEKRLQNGKSFYEDFLKSSNVNQNNNL
jgi:hypothetical protein